jgi:hypothetical protein
VPQLEHNLALSGFSAPQVLQVATGPKLARAGGSRW